MTETLLNIIPVALGEGKIGYIPEEIHDVYSDIKEYAALPEMEFSVYRDAVLNHQNEDYLTVLDYSESAFKGYQKLLQSHGRIYPKVLDLTGEYLRLQNEIMQYTILEEPETQVQNTVSEEDQETQLQYTPNINAGRLPTVQEIDDASCVENETGSTDAKAPQTPEHYAEDADDLTGATETYSDNAPAAADLNVDQNRAIMARRLNEAKAIAVEMDKQRHNNMVSLLQYKITSKLEIDTLKGKIDNQDRKIRAQDQMLRDQAKTFQDFKTMADGKAGYLMRTIHEQRLCINDKSNTIKDLRKDVEELKETVATQVKEIKELKETQASEVKELKETIATQANEAKELKETVATQATKIEELTKLVQMLLQGQAKEAKV